VLALRKIVVPIHVNNVSSQTKAGASQKIKGCSNNHCPEICSEVLISAIIELHGFKKIEPHIFLVCVANFELLSQTCVNFALGNGEL